MNPATFLQGLLTGKRTFLLALAVVGVAYARQQLWIDENTYQWLMPALGAGTAITLRLAIANAIKELSGVVSTPPEGK